MYRHGSGAETITVVPNPGMHDGLLDMRKQPVLLFDQVYYVLAEKTGVLHAGDLCLVALQVSCQHLAVLMLG